MILKVLTDKIKNAIIVYKEKILDIKEISIIYKKYLNSQKTFDEICKESNVVRHYGGYDTLRLPEIDMEGRNPGNILLYMLKNVKRILIDSSDELERIFKYPLSFLIPENNTEEIEINFKSIHQEEFRKYVLKDPFINLLIEHIKSKIVDSNNKHLRETIDFIESFNVTIEKDKKFSGVLLDKINYAQIQKEIETLTETKYKQIEKDAKNRTLTKIVTKKNKEKQEMKDLDIDQLVNYISRKDNNEILKSRCRFVLEIAKENNIQTLILGAFGCGVFGQDPSAVATYFSELLTGDFKDCFHEVVFAIPITANPENYNAFDAVFQQYGLI